MLIFFYKIEFDDLKEAYVEGLNSDELFASLFQEDVDGQKLYLIQGAKELYDEFREKFVTVCKEMYEFGKEKKVVRDKEVGEFWKCFNEAKLSNTEEATKAIDIFVEYKKMVWILDEI